MIRVEKFYFDNKALTDTAFSIREEVFVVEQQVDRAEEYDEFEPVSAHFLAFDKDKAVATARWRETDKGVKLERFAVLKPYRGKGFGNAVLHTVLSDVKSLGKEIYLNAQVSAIPFYEKAGFVKVGDMFEEANIQHFKMIFKK